MYNPINLFGVDNVGRTTWKGKPVEDVYRWTSVKIDQAAGTLTVDTLDRMYVRQVLQGRKSNG